MVCKVKCKECNGEEKVTEYDLSGKEIPILSTVKGDNIEEMTRNSIIEFEKSQIGKEIELYCKNCGEIKPHVITKQVIIN